MRGGFWLPAVLLIFFISILMQQVHLALISVFILFLGGVSRLWAKFCLHRIEYQRRLSRNKAFIGDEITFEIEISNRKPLPLPLIQIEDELPERVKLLKGEAESSVEDRVILKNIFPIKMYHKIIRRFPVRCLQRGIFIFGPTFIRSGDIFGFFRKNKTISKVDHLLVYPRLVPLERLGIPSRQFFGDIRLKRHLFQDPVLSSGVREYIYGDSLKKIHWKSTARTGELQTKQYEPTTTVDLNIFLDVRTLKAPIWGSDYQLQEIGIIAAASIARHALESGFRVGLNVNQIARFAKGMEMVKVPNSRHPDQLMHILEALAQLHQVESMPIAQYIQQEAGNVPWGTALAVISAHPEDKLLSALLEFRRIGRSVSLIKVGGNIREVDRNSLRMYHISDEIAWDLIKEIELNETQID